MQASSPTESKQVQPLIAARLIFTDYQQSRPMLRRMNRGIWMLATWLVMRHGDQAPYAVHARIMDMRRQFADEYRLSVWLMVDAAVRDWAKSCPTARDTIH